MSAASHKPVGPLAVGFLVFWLLLTSAMPLGARERNALLLLGVLSTASVCLWVGRRRLEPLARLHRPNSLLEDGPADVSELNDDNADEPTSGSATISTPHELDPPNISEPPVPYVPDTPPPQPDHAPVVRLHGSVSVAQAPWELHWRVGSAVGVVPLPHQLSEIHIGRDESNHVILSHAQVSSRHLVLQVDANGANVQAYDVGSSNGSAMLAPGNEFVMPARALYSWPPGAKIVIPHHPPAVVELVLIRQGRNLS